MVIENNQKVYDLHLYILIHCDTILKCHGNLQLIYIYIKKKRINSTNLKEYYGSKNNSRWKIYFRPSGSPPSLIVTSIANMKSETIT